MILPIKILSDLISTTEHKLKISSVITNIDGTFTLYVDYTYYLNSQRKVTIDGLVYRIKSFALNESITISGAIIPTATEFTITPPVFKHGTPKKVNGEIKNSNTKSYPFIWLLEFLKVGYNDRFEDSVNASPDYKLFFLTDTYYENWDIDQHYTEAIHPMLNEIDFFIRTIKKRRDLFAELESHDIFNHVNFGEYLTDKGYASEILSGQLSGCQLDITLPYVVDVCNTMPVVSICNPVSIYENLVFKEYIQAGGSFYYTTTGGDDATEIITDSASNVLYTNVIPSGDTETQIITDGNITNSNGSINIPILAQGTEILPDVINIDSDGTPVTTPAQTTFTCTTGGTVLNYIPFSGQTTQYQTYDDGYYYQLGYFSGGILSNYYNLSNSDLTPWSHLKRFTGTTGGYYDEILTTYHNEDGTVSGSHALSFPDGLINDYLTGFEWYYVGAGARTWTLAISETQALTFKGFSDWTIPTKAQIQDIEDNEMSNPYSNGIFNITGDMWSNTTVQANILQAFSFNIQGECTRDNKTIAKFRLLIRKL